MFRSKAHVFAVLGIFLALFPSLSAQRNIPNAFLDGPDRVRFAVDEPVEAEALAGKLSFSLDGVALAVREVRPGGKPVVDLSGMIVLPGTIQGALGGREWAPDDECTRMWERSPGVWEFVASFPKGRYEYKVAQGGTWAKNWGAKGNAGGANIVLSVPASGTIVRFVFDFNTKKIQDSINDPAELKAPSTVPPRPEPVAQEPEGPAVYREFDAMLSRSLGMADFRKPMRLSAAGKDYAVWAREVLSDSRYYHAEDDLGSRWGAEGTSFKVWSPVSVSVVLELFEDASSPAFSSLPMEVDATGTWSAFVSGDLHGKYYRYVFSSYGTTRPAADLSCFSASPDGTRSQIVDLGRTNPEGWADAPIPILSSTTDAVVYEVHARDFSISPESGVYPALRGTYLGLVQRGTRTAKGKLPTGLDYLVGLGITDLHLMPIQKFNPRSTEGYNWGYETNLFNVPESRYATDPSDPLKAIREVKSMVKGLHEAGIRLVLDVVYNHTMPVRGDDSAFDVSVPFYYFRTDDRGNFLNESGVGNAVHDERPMVRKYIRDSLCYWVGEYKVDGFRFDLVGMFSPATVADLSAAVRELRPDALLYGEPWTGGGPTRFGKGSGAGMDFAVFNDHFRNAMRGDLDGSLPGWALGETADSGGIQKGLVGSIRFSDDLAGFAREPGETINYISAHDNMALWDKVALAMGDAKPADRMAAVKLSGALVLLAQGIPFLEGGVELGRTKQGNRNSYKAGDEINRFEWEKLASFKDVADWYAGLIAIRRAHPAFRLSTGEAVRSAMSFLEGKSLPDGVVAFRLDGSSCGDSWKEILVIFNGKAKATSFVLPTGSWSVAANGKKAGIDPIGKPVKGKLKLGSRSAWVLFR